MCVENYDDDDAPDDGHCSFCDGPCDADWDEDDDAELLDFILTGI